MKNYGAYLSDIIDEKNMYSARAKVLLDRIKNLDPKLDHDMKPVVKFSKPSDYRFPTDKYISIQDADTLVRKTDQERFKPLIDGIAGSQLMHVDVTIVYSENQNVKVLQDTIFIGAGDGGIIDHLKRNVNDDMTIKNNKFEKLSPEEQQEYMENLEDVRDHVLPYLQEFISLEEETVHHVSDQSQAKSLNDSTAKKSIHDRLLENKEKISKIQGKDNLQKGVELA